METEMEEGYRSPVSGLTNAEAKELHSGFVGMTILYVAIAVIAHILMWMWRPWFPGTPGYVRTTAETILQTLPFVG